MVKMDSEVKGYAGMVYGGYRYLSLVKLKSHFMVSCNLSKSWRYMGLAHP